MSAPARPKKAEDWPLILWGGLAFFVFCVVVALIKPSQPEAVDPEQAAVEARSAAEYKARAIVREGLKDPDSAQFSGVYVRDVSTPVVCGYVNAKNAFGGFTGRKEWVLIGELAYLNEGAGARTFATLWNSQCAT